MDQKKRIILAVSVLLIAGATLCYAALIHPTCAYKKNYVPDGNRCIVQHVACHGLLCSEEPSVALSCGERTKVCGANLECGCTPEDTTDWK